MLFEAAADEMRSSLLFHHNDSLLYVSDRGVVVQTNVLQFYVAIFANEAVSLVAIPVIPIVIPVGPYIHTVLVASTSTVVRF